MAPVLLAPQLQLQHLERHRHQPNRPDLALRPLDNPPLQQPVRLLVPARSQLPLVHLLLGLVTRVRRRRSQVDLDSRLSGSLARLLRSARRARRLLLARQVRRLLLLSDSPAPLLLSARARHHPHSVNRQNRPRGLLSERHHLPYRHGASQQSRRHHQRPQ